MEDVSSKSMQCMPVVLTGLTFDKGAALVMGTQEGVKCAQHLACSRCAGPGYVSRALPFLGCRLFLPLDTTLGSESRSGEPGPCDAIAR